MSLDGIDCPIYEPHPFDKGYYSFKFNASGIKYEVGVSVKGGHIVWVYGGVPCGEYGSDLKLARESLIYHLLPNEKVVADKVYNDPEHFSTPLTDPGTKEQRDKIRSRHEKVNAMLKCYNCLQIPFRHEKDNHFLCFFAVVNLVELTITYEEPLYPLYF